MVRRGAVALLQVEAHLLQALHCRRLLAVQSRPILHESFAEAIPGCQYVLHLLAIFLPVRGEAHSLHNDS